MATKGFSLKAGDAFRNERTTLVMKTVLSDCQHRFPVWPFLVPKTVLGCPALQRSLQDCLLHPTGCWLPSS